MSDAKTVLVLVDREREHVLAPSLLWLMVARREANALERLRALFSD
ncbi:MAG: hypothetical protein RL685_4521 [Pseudomonadota bacterium]|jgi:hypothetical protein